MGRKKVLITYPLGQEGFEELKAGFDVTMMERSGGRFKPELLKAVKGCHGMIAAGINVDEEIMDAAPELKIISVYGAGYDNVDTKAATARGIVVTNIPDVVTDSTAEITLGLMLSVMRRISELDRRLRQDRGFRWSMMTYMGRDLFGKELGIIGMGRIGKAVAKRAAAFGMRISYYTRKRLDPVIEMELEASYKRMDELLQTADVISIHTPLTEETRHLIGYRELSMMKPGAYLINTSRGPVVDEKALVKCLSEGRIAGAGLDVFENEPKISPELLKMDNVVLTPHIGTDTVETRINMNREAARNIIDFFSGRQPFHVVNPEVLDK
ncbi:MAG: dihydrofolate reductase [Clostridiales bacterium]|jgi:glyoxylate reductase|nr:dihydrofolate reductase [Clostridiales bacterium]